MKLYFINAKTFNYMRKEKCMKKKCFLVLTFLLLFGIVGCGQKFSVSFKTDMPKEIAFDTPLGCRGLSCTRGWGEL